MDSPVLYYACAIIAVIISGLAKGGFAGIGSLAMPIMVLAIDPVRAAAILLPILISQDAVSVWAFRHSWDRHVLTVMLPGMAMGVLPKRLPRDVLVGTTAIAFAVMNWMKVPLMPYWASSRGRTCWRRRCWRRSRLPRLSVVWCS